MWFNPPFNLNTSSKVGKEFRRIIEKHFSSGDLLGKLFDKNKLKLSYSCLGNLKSKISSHNRRVLAEEKEDISCNCRNKTNCPLKGKCTVSDVVYKAEVIVGNQ